MLGAAERTRNRRIIWRMAEESRRRKRGKAVEGELQESRLAYGEQKKDSMLGPDKVVPIRH